MENNNEGNLDSDRQGGSQQKRQRKFSNRRRETDFEDVVIFKGGGSPCFSIDNGGPSGLSECTVIEEDEQSKLYVDVLPGLSECTVIEENEQRLYVNQHTANRKHSTIKSQNNVEIVNSSKNECTNLQTSSGFKKEYNSDKSDEEDDHDYINEEDFHDYINVNKVALAYEKEDVTPRRGDRGESLPPPSSAFNGSLGASEAHVGKDDKNDWSTEHNENQINEGQEKVKPQKFYFVKIQNNPTSAKYNLDGCTAGLRLPVDGHTDRKIVKLFLYKDQVMAQKPRFNWPKPWIHVSVVSDYTIKFSISNVEAKEQDTFIFKLGSKYVKEIVQMFQDQN